MKKSNLKTQIIHDDKMDELGSDENILSFRPQLQALSQVARKPEILIVDDDQDFVEMLVSHIEVAGCEITTVNEGDLALKLFRQNSPNLVITDLIMPKVNGYDLIQEIAKYTHTPIVAISGFEVERDSYESYLIQEHVKKLFKKPFSFDELNALIRQQLKP